MQAYFGKQSSAFWPSEWIQTRKRLGERQKGVLGIGVGLKEEEQERGRGGKNFFLLFPTPPRPLFLNQHGGKSTRSQVYTPIICEH